MANIQLKIKKVDGEYLTLGKQWIDNLELLSQSSSDASSIQYGIVGGSGNVTISDINNSLRSSIEKKDIQDGETQVKVFINNNEIGDFLIDSPQYYNSGMILTSQLISSMDLLKRININKFTTLGEEGVAISLYNLIESYISNSNFSDVLNISKEDFLSNLTKNYVILSDTSIKSSIKDYLQNINISDGSAYIEKIPFFDFLQRIAEATQLSLIDETNGMVCFISQRPIFISSGDYVDNLIKIPNYMTITNLKYDIFKKNKIKTISFNNNEIKTDYIDVTNASISLRNANDELDLSNLDSFQTFEDSSGYYIGFFYTVNGQNIIEPRSKKANKIVIFMKTGSLIQQFGYDFIEKANVDKSSYNFQENKGVYVLSDLSTRNSFVIAICIRVAESSSSSLLETLSEFKLNIFPLSITEINTQKIFSQSNTDGIQYSYQYDNEYLSTSLSITESSTSKSLYTYIFENILSDYKDGISSASIEVFCGNYYDSNGNKAIDWDKGEILKVGDIIYINKDLYPDGTQRYWKITGRRFKYSGAPTLSLELQECKKIS